MYGTLSKLRFDVIYIFLVFAFSVYLSQLKIVRGLT